MGIPVFQVSFMALDLSLDRMTDSLIIAGRLKLGRHRCSSVPFRLIFVLLSAIVAYSALCSRIVSSFVAFSILHELFSHRFQPFRVLGICLGFELSSIIA